jgi:hypothetical protein
MTKQWQVKLIEFGWEPDTVFGRPDSDRCPHGLAHFLGVEKVHFEETLSPAENAIPVHLQNAVHR